MLETPTPITLREHTTFRVGGPASVGLWATGSEEELIEALRAADAEGHDLLVLGGGSNLLVGDEGFDGVVVQDRRSDIVEDYTGTCGGGVLTVSAGTPWDELVRFAVENEYTGVEALSGIPGTVGACPVQNVGAYGQEVAETISHVRVWDRQDQRVRLMTLADLGFGYRTSVLKRSRTGEDGDTRSWGATGRWVVLEVGFQMRRGSLSAPVRYAELARRLDVQPEDRAPATQVRQAVLELRAGKGMVLDAQDHDTWSAGSFFTNPIISEDAAASLPPDAPRFPVTDNARRHNLTDAAPVVPGVVKTSAAWLIDHAGFGKGYSVPGSSGRASLSTRHVLSLTNRGGASAEDVAQLARTVQTGVQQTFGVHLEPEPVVLGLDL